jgi:hypothetical protein
VPADIAADPFRERRRAALQQRVQLLGGQFHFETNDPQLLRFVQLAYAGLPPHRLTAAPPRFLVRLVLAHARSRAPLRKPREPPQVRPLAGAGILCGAMESANFVTIDPTRGAALVVVSQDMLRFPYHVRYEMLEFAVYVLASRVQGLVPLHAACVGRDGLGILLLGPSGSGKSTVSLHCVLQGLEFLSEDSVLVRPDGLLATGVPSFLHVRPDSLRFVTDAGSAAAIRTSSMIRRRSGVEKFEFDLRHAPYRLAPAPLRIAAVVFVSSKSAGQRPLLRSLRKAAMSEQLAAGQPYAANQPGWRAFTQRMSGLPAFELRRGSHPLQAVEALAQLLPPGPKLAVRRREPR